MESAGQQDRLANSLRRSCSGIARVGGRLFKHSVGAVGTAAAEAITRVRADVYFMGVTGSIPSSGSPPATPRRRRSSGRCIARREKLGSASPFLVTRLEEVDTMVVEAGLATTC